MTDPPAQKDVGPPGVIVATGFGFTVIVVGALVAIQLPPPTLTVYEPDAETVIEFVVSPVDQVFPVGAEDVNVTDPPVQKVVGPPGVMVGVTGGAVTVTVVPALVELHVPFETVTVYVPEVETVIEFVVSVVDQVFPEGAEEVSVTDPPVQKVVGPPATITGTLGEGFTVTTVGADAATHPEPFPTVTE